MVSTILTLLVSCFLHYAVAAGPVPQSLKMVRFAESEVPETVRQHAGLPPIECAMQICTLLGATYTCLFKEPGQPDQEMTCSDYAKTSQSQAQCQFECTGPCYEPVIPTLGTFDNNRKRYCNSCTLRQASCAADYEIYGPHLPPGYEYCSEEYCSANGDERCLPNAFYSIFVLCSDWLTGNYPGGTPQ